MIITIMDMPTITITTAMETTIILAGGTMQQALQSTCTAMFMATAHGKGLKS